MVAAGQVWHRVYLGLGSNLESPQAQVAAALDAIAALAGVRLVARSSMYVSAPVGFAEQPDFVNAVALIETQLAPASLLEALLGVERGAGRVRAMRNGPRTLDIDILLFDDCVVDEPALTVPHPRICERAFVLLPLVEIAPEVEIPGRGRASDFLPAVAGQACRRAE